MANLNEWCLRLNVKKAVPYLKFLPKSLVSDIAFQVVEKLGSLNLEASGLYDEDGNVVVDSIRFVFDDDCSNSVSLPHRSGLGVNGYNYPQEFSIH